MMKDVCDRHPTGFTLRLFDPRRGAWKIWWNATAKMAIAA
jgi:hypothetical protein